MKFKPKKEVSEQKVEAGIVLPPEEYDPECCLSMQGWVRKAKAHLGLNLARAIHWLYSRD